MNTSQHIHQIEDVQILKDKILKIDSIFTLVAEKQRKIAVLETKCKRAQQDNNKLESQNHELHSEIERRNKDHEQTTNEYQAKLLDEIQKYHLLEDSVKKIKNNNKRVIQKYQKIFAKNKNHLNATKKKYALHINQLKRTIKYLRIKLKKYDLGKENKQPLVEESAAQTGCKQPIQILQNLIIKPPNKQEEAYDIDRLLNEMTVLPELMRPFEEEVCHRDAQTQTTRSNVTRPVQTDSLTTARKETQTYIRSIHTDVQCNLDIEEKKNSSSDTKKLFKSQSIQTDLPSNIKNTQTMNIKLRTSSAQTNFIEKKITMKQAVAALKKSRKTFSISNGVLLHYSKNPTTCLPSTNGSTLAKVVYRRLKKYIDNQYLNVDSKKHRRSSNILCMPKQLERSRELMQLCRSSLANMGAISDTESSGYESRAMQRARCFEDLLMDGQMTPSSQDSGVLSDMEVVKDWRSEKVGDINSILNEMLVDVPNLILPFDNDNDYVEDLLEDNIVSVPQDNHAIATEIRTEIRQVEKPRKRPVNRMQMLKRGIKKCNQINIFRTPKVDQEQMPQVNIPQCKNATVRNTAFENKRKCIGTNKVVVTATALKPDMDHTYAAQYSINNKPKKTASKPNNVITSPILQNFQIEDICSTPMEICPDFGSLDMLDVAENVVTISEAYEPTTSNNTQTSEKLEKFNKIATGSSNLKESLVRVDSQIINLSNETSADEVPNCGLEQKRRKSQLLQNSPFIEHVNVTDKKVEEVCLQWVNQDPTTPKLNKITIDQEFQRMRKRCINSSCKTANILTKASKNACVEPEEKSDASECPHDIIGEPIEKPEMVNNKRHKSPSLSPQSSISIHQMTTRSAKTTESPNTQDGTSGEIQPSSVSNCVLKRKREPSCNDQTNEETIDTSEHQNESEDHSKLGCNDADINIHKKVSYRTIKTALDRFVWLKGNARICKLDVQLLKTVKAFQLIDYIILYLSADKGETEKPKSTTTMEPLLTIRQKVILGLLLRIERELNSADYVTLLISNIEKHLLFNVKFKPECLENLSRFYTALCRLKQKKHRVRVFLADLLYHNPSHKFVIIYTIVTSWLNVLQPYKDVTTDAGFDHVLAHIAMTQPNQPTTNTNIVGYIHDNCIGVFKNLLVTYYNFPRTEFCVDDLTMSLLESFMCGGHVQFETAILILCVHSSAQWTYEKVQLIGELCKVSTDVEVVRNLLKLIANIAKKIDTDYNDKIRKFQSELFAHLTVTNTAMQLDDLKHLSDSS